MLFRYSPTNRIMRLVAALLLAMFGVFLLGTLPPLGLLLAGGGLGIMLYQGFQLWRERPGAYSLERLRLIHDKELAREEPEEDHYERDMVYCHRCGLSVPDTHAICPECGGFLGK